MYVWGGEVALHMGQAKNSALKGAGEMVVKRGCRNDFRTAWGGGGGHSPFNLLCSQKCAPLLLNGQVDHAVSG